MIESTTPAAAQQQMNEYGRRRQPFFFLIDFEMARPVVCALEDIDPDCLRYAVNGQSNLRPPVPGPQNQKKEGGLLPLPLPFGEYEEGFRYVQSQLQLGNSYLTNLTYPTPIRTDHSLLDIFRRSEARYRVWWKGRFTVFSPEIFVTISEQGRIASFPMKGTVRADLPDAEALLLNDDKERAEHATIVDLIRNDLSMVARRVRVSRYRYVERITASGGDLLQTSSEIEGQVGVDYHERLGDILFHLLPAGSISGAPKRETVRIIQRAEGQPRGYYTGIGGLYNGRSLDSGVMIRFVEQTPGGLAFRSGGGITARSHARQEYEEMIGKVYLPWALKPTMAY